MAGVDPWSERGEEVDAWSERGEEEVMPGQKRRGCRCLVRGDGWTLVKGL